MLRTLSILAGGWGLVMALAPSLQIRRIWRTRSSGDVSLAYYGVLLPGFALWTLYGVAIDTATLAIPNGVAFCVHLTTAALVRRYRKPVVPASRVDKHPSDELHR